MQRPRNGSGRLGHALFLRFEFLPGKARRIVLGLKLDIATSLEPGKNTTVYRAARAAADNLGSMLSWTTRIWVLHQ